MLLVYLKKITPRNRYCFKTVFQTLLGFSDYELTSEEEVFTNHNGPKISYGRRALGQELHFGSQGLLEEKGIKEQSVTVGSHEDTVTLFVLDRGALPYDPFAAIFYMLSRYEEYLPHLRDQYDRFTVSESIANQYGFLQTAVVERWTFHIREVLLKSFPDLNFGNRKYSYIPTIDIDNAYAFKEKGLLRSLGSLLRNLVKMDFNKLGSQLLVILRRKKDPFDTYNYQLNIQKKYDLKPIYFFLLADYGLNDKNLSHENRHFQSLIKSIADYAEVGIHPSYGSNQDKSKLKREVKRLERIVKRDIFRSRQHFLKLSLPETYRNLMEEDIQEDYTMGFAGQPGFRAGTCTPFKFYDLDEELECKLTVYPFQLMESTFKYYLKISPEGSIEMIKKIIDEVREVKGTFISLWHNESLSEEDEWVGWRNVYEEMVEYASKK